MSKHLKRLATPRSWSVARKLHYWAFKPAPGAHPLERAIPLAMVLRDYLKVCDTGREARRIIGAGDVQIDGRVRKDYKHPVGFMDVVSLPKLNAHYRILLAKGRLQVSEIPAENSTWKLVRVENKTTIKGGRTQLNLHDGRNVIIGEGEYKTGDVLKLSIPEQNVLDRFEFSQGRPSMIIGGSHAGKIATIDEINVTKNPKDNIVNMKMGEESFSTIKTYVFPVGRERPEIKLPEVNILE